MFDTCQSMYRSTFVIPETFAYKIFEDVSRVRCATLNSNQSKECERIMEFPLIHFNILREDLSTCAHLTL